MIKCFECSSRTALYKNWSIYHLREIAFPEAHCSRARLPWGSSQDSPQTSVVILITKGQPVSENPVKHLHVCQSNIRALVSLLDSNFEALQDSVAWKLTVNAVSVKGGPAVRNHVSY